MALEPEEIDELVEYIEINGARKFVEMLASTDIVLASSAQIIPDALVNGMFCIAHRDFTPKVIIDGDDGNKLRDATYGEHLKILIQHWEEKHK